MFKPFRTAAVLGAGVMGTQIATHLANAGLIVYLLDLPAAGDWGFRQTAPRPCF
ncbi:MAG: 3-hydroxyacyl-CoA dehydrogenase NAD-binding domain-containing protein [Cyanobacteria bacterium P01_A01_bin.17]